MKITHEQLAATGKYYNTGKVLIGLAYTPRVRKPSYDERIIQNILLHTPRPLIKRLAGWLWP